MELVSQGVPTLTAAAAMAVPVTFKPARGARETYHRLGDQARVQHQQRTEKKPIVELLAIEEGAGLRRLPAPSSGDLFLDLEGASFAREGGRDYLFGLWTGHPEGLPPQYRAWWAVDDAQEKAAFEEVMETITAADAVGERAVPVPGDGGGCERMIGARPQSSTAQRADTISARFRLNTRTQSSTVTCRLRPSGPSISSPRFSTCDTVNRSRICRSAIAASRRRMSGRLSTRPRQPSRPASSCSC